jgi:signal transduction histidine kinase/ActR/RegA family two-component response regulator
MWTFPRSRLRRYLLPFATILLALVGHWAISLAVPKGVDFPYAFVYLIAAFASAWYGGYGPGVICSVLILVGLPALVTHSFRWSSIDSTRLIPMIGVSLLVSKVSRGQERVRTLMRSANDELEARVQSRTSDLAAAVAALESEVAQRTYSEQRLQTQLGRLNLLDRITRAIGERQDLGSVFQVVVRTLEDSLPIDFGCICIYNADTEILTVRSVGVRCETLATELALTDQAQIPIDQNGLARCINGDLVYEPDVSQLDFPFPRRLAAGGLCSVVMAPLLSESVVFGTLVVARRDTGAFSSGDCEFLRQLSEHVALAANQAQIYSALQQAYDDLRKTQQSVMEQERLRALGQMASGIAHDVNNALSPVALYTESLLDREPDLSPRTRSYLETTQRAIEDVAHTVGRLREFYRKPEQQLQLTQIDLNQLIAQVLELTRARWSDIPQQRGLVIQARTDLEAGLPSVAGVESEVREALTNLVLNAVDAMPEGGTLTLRTLTLRTPDASSKRRVGVEVVDTGMGMEEETRRRCLEPFFTTKGERGTGLGLAMVYGVAQRHDADIEIESSPGRGTTMRLNFPVSVRTVVETSKLAYTPPRVSRMRILVVDDDPLIIKSLRDILEGDGHVVTAASGGREGIEILQSAVDRKEEFSLVMTDLGMPYIDGRQVASAVKKICVNTPVILLTGWGKRLVAEGDIPPNVDRVLNKPPKLNQLRTTLAELAPRAASSGKGLA